MRISRVLELLYKFASSLIFQRFVYSHLSISTPNFQPRQSASLASDICT